MPEGSEETTRVQVQREFAIEQLEEGDGRTVHARIIPYNTEAEVADPPHYTPYREAWLPGVFARQTRAADKVKILANFEHEQGIAGVVGHGVGLEDQPDGLYGTVRMHESAIGETTLHLIREGIVDGVSLEAIVLRSRRTDGDVVERVRAHLDKVAFVRMAAFEDAKVLAVRSGELDDPDEEIDLTPKPAAVDLSPPVDPEVTARLEALGFRPITRAGVTADRWDADPSRFEDEQYAASCLIDRGGDMSVKARSALPVLEPDGRVNVQAVRKAEDSLCRNSVGNISSEQRREAARKLIRYMRVADVEPSPMLVSLARR